MKYPLTLALTTIFCLSFACHIHKEKETFTLILDGHVYENQQPLLGVEIKVDKEMDGSTSKYKEYTHRKGGYRLQFNVKENSPYHLYYLHDQYYLFRYESNPESYPRTESNWFFEWLWGEKVKRNKVPTVYLFNKRHQHSSTFIGSFNNHQLKTYWKPTLNSQVKDLINLSNIDFFTRVKRKERVEQLDQERPFYGFWYKVSLLENGKERTGWILYEDPQNP